MKNANEVMQELKQLPTFKVWGTRKEVKYLPDVLMPDERILSVVSGFLDGNTWLIALTDRRMIFLDKGMIYGLKQREIPLDKINSISHKLGLVLGSVIVQDGATFIKIDNIDKSVIPSFVEAANHAMHAHVKDIHGSNRQTSTVSAADEIIKFKNLLDSGIITQEEFEAKKRQLLGL